MAAYYNEFDPKAAAWLRELIKGGHIAPGEVDERSITDVKPDDLAGFTQCHFFAGIGGWSYALRLAGWPDDEPVWTGSCPCQPFSTAGKKSGINDARHLWPDFFRLIQQHHPATIFGEQVASSDGLGWLDIVSADLEATGYAFGAADLCAAGVGAPHVRQRLFFVGDARSAKPRRLSNVWGKKIPALRSASQVDQLANNDSPGFPNYTRGKGPPWENGRSLPTPNLLDAWRNAQWLECSDGKARAVEPGIFPLADGLPYRVGLLRGYGNAIVPEVAQAFIEAYLDGFE